MSKEDVKLRLKSGWSVGIKRFQGCEMHNREGGDLWKYLNCDESSIKDDAIYKVWCDADSPREAFDRWSYLVLYFEEVPREILELEGQIKQMKKRCDDYWNVLTFWI